MILSCPNGYTGRKELVMKGYNTPYGYMGYVNGTYVLFASEADYMEYMEGEEE